MKDNMYFKSYEFDSPDQKDSGVLMREVFCDKLIRLRQICNFPFAIASGYRTKEYNKKIGGAENSAHMRGYAADIYCDNSYNRYKIIAGALAVGFVRMGIGVGFIHLDCDPELPKPCMWTYNY